jgi:hypothetical protein
MMYRASLLPELPSPLAAEYTKLNNPPKLAQNIQAAASSLWQHYGPVLNGMMMEFFSNRPADRSGSSYRTPSTIDALRTIPDSRFSVDLQELARVVIKIIGRMRDEDRTTWIRGTV